MNFCLPNCGRGAHSLRAKLTLANLVLLALGIVMATAVSLMGMRHYLLAQVDTELTKSRDSLSGSQLTMAQLNMLSTLSGLGDHLMPQRSAASANPDKVFAAVDAHGKVLTIAGFAPTADQRALAALFSDPAALAADGTPRDISLGDDPYRAIGTRLADGTYILIAASTGGLHHAMAKALKLDLAFGSLLLVLLAALTMMNVRRRMLPLEDMVETSTAIAEGDLTRRVPSSHHPTQEVEQLRVALNSMLHQVESAYRTRERTAAQLRRFVADASHELRTRCRRYAATSSCTTRAC